MDDVKKITEFINVDSGDGSGDGFGFGDGIKSFNGKIVHIIDNVPTIIDHVHKNIAKGHIVMNDLTTKPCYIVKQNGMFAHGTTLRDAITAIRDKLFDDMSVEDRISAFVTEHKGNTPYPNKDLYDWHHRLTRSCDMGREAFITNHGLSLDGKTTVEEFIRLTENEYGGDIIKKLRQYYPYPENNTTT